MNSVNRCLLTSAALLIGFVSGSTLAQVTVEVVGGESNRIPIAVLSFHGDTQAREENSIGRVIAADLSRSSALRVVEASGLGAGFDDQVDHSYFSASGTDMVVVGKVSKKGKTYKARYALVDVARRTRILEETFTESTLDERHLAHRIADRIHEQITGYPGAFATRICYIAREGHSSEIVIADADGYNRRVLYKTDAPIMSPKWSPDGKRLAYVSFERQRPRIYVHNVVTGKRKVVANFRGTNSAPAWSPDGKYLAVTLSKDNGSQIYLINSDGGKPRRLSNSQSRDTEPDFSPEGQHILFTSDRGGTPQIYRLPIDGSESAIRMTYDGRYNTSPKYAADGMSFAFVRMESGLFSIAIQDIGTGDVSYLTSGRDDRSPAFAPNGQSILYATEVKGRGALGAISVDGSTRWGIATYAHDIRGPDWGPYESQQVEVTQ